jgi:hypothetical protein
VRVPDGARSEGDQEGEPCHQPDSQQSGENEKDNRVDQPPVIALQCGRTQRRTHALIARWVDIATARGGSLLVVRIPKACEMLEGNGWQHPSIAITVRDSSTCKMGVPADWIGAAQATSSCS